LLARVPVTWFSQVLKSCISMDRRDGGSVGGPLVAACAAGAKTDNKKNREKLVLATLAFIVFTPGARAKWHTTKLLGTRAMLRHTPGELR
jgi:hypothetical protein